MKRGCGPGFVIKMIVGIIICTIVMSVATMLLWNWLIPDIFHVRAISFIEALGLLALAKILFGFKGGWKGGCHGGHCGPGEFGPRGYWRKRWEEKLAKMSPEEREKAKEKYKKCCGPWESSEGEINQVK